MWLLTSQDSVHNLVSRTWIYLTWKIIYADLSEMEKHFYKKIYIITLCNFWHRSYSWPNTQHIQKIATEELWFLRYYRSRVFTFVFFMKKLKGISSVQNNKSCSINHHESNKIGFTFVWIFCDFLRNLQEAAKAVLLFKLYLSLRPLERSGRLQCGPWAAGQRRSGQIPASRRRTWPGKGVGRG
jgi:hypothetical protein